MNSFVFYPYLSVPTGSVSKTDLLIDNIKTMIRCPNYEASKNGYHWSFYRHWEEGGTKEDIQLDIEGFDKIGYLRVDPSEHFFTVRFYPKSNDCQQSPIAAAFLLARFAYFLKKYIKGAPRDMSITIQ